MRKFSLFCIALCFSGFHPLLAAPDFKIRYNQKFPCLEVMDSKAVKITDITEGAKGETVTSGKSSISISFSKNDAGQPEVVLSEAKSSLSEMEVEAFGLSVGLKPEGTVLVRFGPDNKPKFEMDRTGGARFLMADLGNLDTAAGKELTSVPSASPSDEKSAPSKALTRCRERFAAWKEGKGGWSNKSGKILQTSGGETLKIGKDPQPRALLEGEAVQVGGTIVSGSRGPMVFQSAAGVFHQVLPGTEIVLSPLEKDSVDIKVELKKGTLLTYVAAPLVAPRGNLVVIADGIVARTVDGLYQITKEADGKSLISVVAGKVILADVAGGAERGSVSANQKLTYPGDKPTPLAGGTPEGVSLKALPEKCREATLMDIAQDGFFSCPEAGQEIFSEVRTLRPDLLGELAKQALENHPTELAQIQLWSGIPDLKITAKSQAQSFLQVAEEYLKTHSGKTAQAGKVLEVEGDVKADSKSLRVGDIIAPGSSLVAEQGSSLTFVACPGVIGQVKGKFKGTLAETRAEFRQEEMVSSFARLKAEVGEVRLAIVDGRGDKIHTEIETPKGIVSGKSTPGKKGDTKL